MIYLEDKKAGSIYLGDKKLSKIYLGDKLVWEGYKKGHIVGKATVTNNNLQAYSFYDAKGTAQTLSCTSDANKKYDLDLTSFGGYGDRSRIFYFDSQWATIDSFKVTMYISSIYYEVYLCGNLTKLNLNGIKFVPTNTGGTKVNIDSSFRDCSKLEYIYAGGMEWSKVDELSSSFCNLPSLIELDLSGANFDNISSISTTVFEDIGKVGTIVKVLGCSENTQNRIFNALKVAGNYHNQTWELKDGIITRME